MSVLSTANALTPAQAMWRQHLFMPPGQKFDILSSGTWDGQLTYKAELDAKQQETTEAQNPINNKGDDKQKSFSIRIEVNKLASGLDPLTVHKSLSQDLGKKGYFFIGSLPIDKSYYFLKGVELHFSNIDLATDGSPYRADITLQFVEDVIMRVEKKKESETISSKTGKKTASKVGASKAAKKAAKDDQIKQWQKELGLA